MRIQKIAIHNFRVSTTRVGLPTIANILGPNNHGKSNILSAIELPYRPLPARRLTISLLSRKGESEMWVDLEFAELTEQEQTTFRKYVTQMARWKFARRPS